MKIMTPHTPGPWRVEKTLTCGMRIVHGEEDADGFSDDVPFGRGGIATTDEEQANTLLAAAAPELREALAQASVECANADGSPENVRRLQVLALEWTRLVWKVEGREGA